MGLLLSFLPGKRECFKPLLLCFFWGFLAKNIIKITMWTLIWSLLNSNYRETRTINKSLEAMSDLILKLVSFDRCCQSKVFRSSWSFRFGLLNCISINSSSPLSQMCFNILCCRVLSSIYLAGSGKTGKPERFSLYEWILIWECSLTRRRN